MSSVPDRPIRKPFVGTVILDGHSNGYAHRTTTQIAVKLPDEMLSAIDLLVADAHFDSRSDAVRAGLYRVIADKRRAQIDDAFASAFDRCPESDVEMRRAHDLARQAIDDEPWQKWW